MRTYSTETSPFFDANLQTAWQGFLLRGSWTSMVTLTFADPVSSWTACHRFRALIGKIELSTRTEIQWVAVVAPQRLRAVPHMHALLSGRIEPMRLTKACQSIGWARVRPIHDAAGAVAYIVRHIVRGADVLLSDGLSLAETAGPYVRVVSV